MGWNDKLSDPNDYQGHVDRMLQAGDELRKERRYQRDTSEDWASSDDVIKRVVDSLDPDLGSKQLLRGNDPEAHRNECRDDTMQPESDDD